MFFSTHCVVTLGRGGGVAGCDTFLQRERLLEKPCSVPYTVGSRKYTTNHLKSLDWYFLLKMCTCCMQAVKYFTTLKGGGGHM